MTPLPKYRAIRYATLGIFNGRTFSAAGKNVIKVDLIRGRNKSNNKDGRDARLEFAAIFIARTIDITDPITKAGRVEIDIGRIKGGRHDC